MSLHDFPNLLHLFVFLMYQHLLFYHLFSFENKSFLKCFYFLLHFVNIRISSFKIPASMNVERILQFFRKRFDFEFLLNQLGLNIKDLVLQSGNTIALLHEYFKLSFQILFFVFEQLKISQSLPECSLSFGKS